MKQYADYYFRKAKAENYPARSVYKLKEVDARFHLLRRGMKILDLGAAPGSWSLGAAEKIGASGLVLACDIKDTATVFPSQVIFMRENIFEPSEAFSTMLAEKGPFDLVLSDMAPATTGNRLADQARSLDLVQRALEVALANSRKGAALVTKIFMGPDIAEVLMPMRKNYGSVKTFKPKSSRSESYETFIVCLDLCRKDPETQNTMAS